MSDSSGWIDPFVDLGLAVAFAGIWFMIGWFSRRTYVKWLGHRWVDEYVKKLLDEHRKQKHLVRQYLERNRRLM